MDSQVKDIIKNIKSLKIQGARNVAKAAIKALGIQIKNSKSKSTTSFYKEILKVSQQLKAARPTEPMTRNSLDDITNFLFQKIKSSKSLKEIKTQTILKEKQVLAQMEKNAKNLAQYGARLIQNDSIIMTHCHSSTVTKILIAAKKQRKKFKVICCETRPRYQGRLTAKELIQNKIDTTLIVDGAMNFFMRKVDMCIVGADAINSTGELINKVGTSTLAHIARFHDVPFYCAAETFKYNPLTLYGNKEKIEKRNPKEVWDKPPRKLKISNLAFDITDSRYISAYITEKGIISPQSLLSAVDENF